MSTSSTGVSSTSCVVASPRWPANRRASARRDAVGPGGHLGHDDGADGQGQSGQDEGEDHRRGRDLATLAVGGHRRSPAAQVDRPEVLEVGVASSRLLGVGVGWDDGRSPAAGPEDLDDRGVTDEQQEAGEQQDGRQGHALGGRLGRGLDRRELMASQRRRLGRERARTRAPWRPASSTLAASSWSSGRRARRRGRRGSPRGSAAGPGCGPGRHGAQRTPSRRRLRPPPPVRSRCRRRRPARRSRGPGSSTAPTERGAVPCRARSCRSGSRKPPQAAMRATTTTTPTGTATPLTITNTARTSGPARRRRKRRASRTPDARESGPSLGDRPAPAQVDEADEPAADALVEGSSRSGPGR